jgi:hypothetical protein
MLGTEDHTSEVASIATPNSTLEQKIETMTKALADLATKVSNLSMHMKEIDGRTTPSVSATSNHPGFPYGLPSYGGILETQAPSTSTSTIPPPTASAFPPHPTI